MAACVIVFVGIVVTGHCLESNNWQHHRRTQPAALDDASASNETTYINTDIFPNQNEEVQKQNQTTLTLASTLVGTKEIKNNRSEKIGHNYKIDRFPQLPDSNGWLTQENSDYWQLMNKTENSQHSNQNLNDSNIHDHAQVPLSEGKPVSTDNWGLSDVPSVVPGIMSIKGGEKLTAIEAPLLQWHVGIYSKSFEPYMQICGGTLVTTKAVISAAHCFWNDLEGALPASRFLAAAGKLYRPWNDSHDIHAQKSEILSVHLPARFRGALTSFQDDIAAVLLTTAFAHSAALRPLCVLFDEDLEYSHLQKGKEGVVLGWGLTEENGPPAQALQYLYMPYVPVEECVAQAETNFLKYITSDKICAGVTTGKALCRGDSGGGLVFFDQSSTERVPILLGVASTAPSNEHLCNTHALATLTRVQAHRAFLRMHIPDIEEACGKNYVTFASGTLQDDLVDDKSAVQLSPQRVPTPTKFICNCYCNGNSTKS